MSTRARSKQQETKPKPMAGCETWAEEAAHWQGVIAADNLPEKGWTEGPTAAKTRPSPARSRPRSRSSRSSRRSAAHRRSP
jgi:hypothetical protein